MDRKNTILLAVLINAGLLVVLFVTAMTSQDEVTIPPTHEMAQSTAPLFVEEVDLALRQPVSAPKMPDSLPQVLPEPVVAAKPSEPPRVHPLPPLVPEAVPLVAAPAPSFQGVTVKKGDTLEKIAKAHRTTVDEIIKCNELPSSFLRIGQMLKMPAAKGAIAKAAAPEKRSAESAPDYYIVKVGDNPWTIAMKHHLKVEELLKLNSLNDEKARRLKPGDRLRIR